MDRIISSAREGMCAARKRHALHVGAPIKVGPSETGHVARGVWGGGRVAPSASGVQRSAKPREGNRDGSTETGEGIT